MVDKCDKIDIDEYNIDDFYDLLGITENDLKELTDTEKRDLLSQLISAKKYETNNIELHRLYDEIFAKILTSVQDYNEVDDAYNEQKGNTTKVKQQGNTIIQDEPREVETSSDNIARGDLNPTKKSLITRTINIDSSYRANLSDPSTDFTVILSEDIKNVVSMSLTSIEIPFTWYTFDSGIGTCCFWIDNVEITISPGNYSRDEIIAEISNAIVEAEKGSGATYNSINGKCTLLIDGSQVVFYDVSGDLFCEAVDCKKGTNSSSKKNYNLGILLGFSQSIYTVVNSSLEAENVMNVSSTNYLLLVVDDFKSSRLNNGLVSIVKVNQNLNIPEYFTEDIGFVCEGGKTIPVGNAPRQLTEKQLYTSTEIILNRSNTTEHLLVSPTTTDVLARIPIDQRALSFGDTYVLLGSMISTLKREYFGPVDLGSLHIRLLDSRGNELNLNGSNWSFCLTCEQLYQY